MQNVTKYNKAIVSLILALVGIYNLIFNTDLALDEAALTAAVSLLTPLLVYLVPNKNA